MPAIFKKLSSPMAGARQVAKVAQVRGNPTATHTPDNPLTKRCLGGNLVSLGRSQKARALLYPGSRRARAQIAQTHTARSAPQHGPRRLEGRGAQSRLARVGYCLVFCTSLFGIIGGAAVRILAN